MSGKRDATEEAEIRLLADGWARSEEPSGMVYDFKELLPVVVSCLGGGEKKRRDRGRLSPSFLLKKGLVADTLTGWPVRIMRPSPLK